MNTQEHVDQEVLKVVRKLTRFLRAEKIDFDEFASNLIIHLVGAEFRDVSNCLVELSVHERNGLVEYAREYFDSNDFMPSPTVFMVDTRDPTEVEKKRHEMRPKYERLMEYLDECNK